jgi:mono/diheme cytochrome c family protein
VNKQFPAENERRIFMAFRRVLVKVVPAGIAAVILAVTLNVPLTGFQKQEEGKSLPQEKGRSQFMEGPAVFQAYCAVCHGKNAMGGGPAAGALKTEPPDLTRISQRNGGIFPFERVQKIISGDGPGIRAHGSREMPVWGPIFDEISWDGAPGSFRIFNLTIYIQALQQK